MSREGAPPAPQGPASQPQKPSNRGRKTVLRCPSLSGTRRNIFGALLSLGQREAPLHHRRRRRARMPPTV